MNFTKEEIKELTEYLVGSCKTLNEGISDILSTANPVLEFDEEDLNQTNLQQIDDEIFRCAVCGWWYEVGEASEAEDECICIECNND